MKRILKSLLYLTVKAYFRSITINNIEAIPKKGPVLFVANHPSAFMDPIVITVFIDRILHYLARGESFANPVSRFIFTRLNMIPMYRAFKTPDEMHKNKAVFQKCFDHLKERGAIIIFPEGLSKTQRRLGPIKTGAARITLGAEAQNEFKLGCTIVPIGINYSDPHAFYSDLLLNIGEPIQLADYQKIYEENDRGAVQELTDRIKRELENNTVVIQDEELDGLIANIETIYRSKLRETSEDEEEQSVHNFRLSKEIVDAVHHFNRHEPERVSTIKSKIENYLGGLRHLKIRDTQMRGQEGANFFLSWLYLVVLFPAYLIGFVINYIPYKMTGVVTSRFLNREDFRGSLQLASGMFIFLIFYVGIACSVLLFFSKWVALVTLGLSYPFGLFALHYARQFYRMKSNWRFMELFMKDVNQLAKLATMREEIIEELEKGKTDYLQMKEN
ncbi:MAG: 1-acyl-sn-glycerol-3-phosphate acyltransferase [Bacteroidetes bacterium]|nr:1-acyl-sn-glycerol-3-phosphate acyltransferase [Bacteroidota bacterium]